MTLLRTTFTLAALLAAAVAVPMPAAADHDLVIVAFDAATQYGDTVFLSAQLLDTGSSGCEPRPCPAPGRQVDFYVDGAFVGTDVTNSGGFAYLLASSPDWHAGDHLVTARYDRFVFPSDPATDIALLAVSPEGTVTLARDGYVEAQLLTDDGDPLVGFPVEFALAGTPDVCTAFTDATGTARCAGSVGAGLAPLHAEPLTYYVDYGGSPDFVESRDSATLL